MYILTSKRMTISTSIKTNVQMESIIFQCIVIQRIIQIELYFKLSII